jgi:uncharacterized protein
MDINRFFSTIYKAIKPALLNVEKKPLRISRSIPHRQGKVIDKSTAKKYSIFLNAYSYRGVSARRGAKPEGATDQRGVHIKDVGSLTRRGIRAMKKSFWSILAAVAVAGMMVGPAAAQNKKHDMLRMVSGTPTGTWFPTGAAVAELTNKHYQGEPISVTPGSGAIGNIMMVGAGKADMGISYGAFLMLAQKGGNDINPGKPIPQLRAIMSFVPTILHIITSKTAGFDTMADIKAKKLKVNIATGVKGASETFAMAKILEFHGVTMDDIKAWGGSVIRGVSKGREEAWMNRKADIVPFMWTPPHAKFAHLLSSRDAQLLSLPADLRAFFTKTYGYSEYTFAPNLYKNQPKEVNTIGFPMTIFTTDAVDEELIYLMAKSVAEKPKRMFQVSGAFERWWKPEGMANGVGVQIHDGAKRYYKERGWVN